jgi:hypothetical protein
VDDAVAVRCGKGKPATAVERRDRCAERPVVAVGCDLHQLQLAAAVHGRWLRVLLVIPVLVVVIPVFVVAIPVLVVAVGSVRLVLRVAAPRFAPVALLGIWAINAFDQRVRDLILQRCRLAARASGRQRQRNHVFAAGAERPGAAEQPHETGTTHQLLAHCDSTFSTSLAKASATSSVALRSELSPVACRAATCGCQVGSIWRQSSSVAA